MNGEPLAASQLSAAWQLRAPQGARLTSVPKPVVVIPYPGPSHRQSGI